MLQNVRQKESSSSNDSEEMTSIDMVFNNTTNKPRFSHDRSTLEDLAAANAPERTTPRNSLHAAPHPEHHKQAKVQTFLEMIKSKFFISLLILVAVFVTLLCIGLVVAYEKENDVTHSIDAWKDKLSAEQSEWFDSGLDELKIALQTRINTRRAKNVVLFVGDGMGPNTVTATRLDEKGEEGLLRWEQFPHMGLLKPYCVDKQVPDSAVAATALFGGVKGNYETSGVDSAVELGNCAASQTKLNQVDSILKWAQDEGMSTGFVTTTRVMHATPAALYAHSPDRRWECEAKMPYEARQLGCKDIARQLIEDAPGRDLNVIMGGGRQCMESGVTGTPDDPIDTWSCVSADGRHLIQDWRQYNEARARNYAVVQNTQELEAVGAHVDHVLGIFANGHLKFDHERNKGPAGTPSLQQMTEKAIQVLSKNAKGFILVVESGLIDQAHHRGLARVAINETAALNAAVEATLDILKPRADESLVIVTADHTHTLSINGYPKRGSSIFGVSPGKNGETPYTTLTYATGGPAGFQMELDSNGQPRRRDPSADDTTAFGYVQQVAVQTDENTHGGGDVTIHAIGPMAHLFHRVHEQSYVAHVISYAARIGRFRDNQVVQSFLDMLGIS